MTALTALTVLTGLTVLTVLTALTLLTALTVLTALTLLTALTALTVLTALTALTVLTALSALTVVRARAAAAQGLYCLDSSATAALLKELSKQGHLKRAVDIFDWLRSLPATHELSHLCDLYTYTTMISQVRARAQAPMYAPC